MKALIYTGHPAWKESLNPIIKSRWEQHINEIPEIESFRLYSIYHQSQKDIESQLKDEEILIGFNIDNYLDESFFERHPNLKYISTLAMGYGNFDRDAAKKHNVTLTNTVYGAQTIAQFTMALLLDICHDIRGNSDFIKKAPDNVLSGGTFFNPIDRQIELYGKTLGIIGGTGSGKSTLVSLIPRLYDASTGRVSVMGADVRAWPLDQLRHAVATVPQRASLVSGTIRSNLTWRDEAATDEELWAALDMAQASEFVHKKSQGLDAPVEAGGKNFSGGQRQRLTIARALVGSPQVLIMDDSASALDFKTDAALRHAIRERSMRGAAAGGLPLTTVIVSQRVSTVRDADMICVLDHGSVAGLGTHDELYTSCQLYREICQSQLRREELEGQQGSTTPTSAPVASASVCAKEGC